MRRTVLILDASADLQAALGPAGRPLAAAFLADLRALAGQAGPAVVQTTRVDRAAADLVAALRHGPALLISGDVPHLPPARLRDAYTLLAGGAELVAGPCDQGSWYLLGLGAADLLSALPLPGADLGAPLAALAALGRPAALLPPWYRISAPEHLPPFARALRTMPASVAPQTRRLLDAGDTPHERALGA